ncbi:FtsK/SpoIIIE domain-containing protein [Romboutsia sp.]|uniref:FtsK/SpoIIIE domain-containing protein n=1 Tax=Romboutsia sp. TaxID=1965302 RepID=UPI002BFA0AF2|nr:FtsK/SpoIIIE domain-containing protein [Romboutsia sp.]HSQ88705.1 FtsK/SpoIIIE domain-containing protein [Romboutsia sp.]
MSSGNIFAPVVDSMFECVVGAWKLFKDIKFDKSMNIDFNKLFKNMKFKNIDEVYPKLEYKRDTEYFREFEFSVPFGMSIEDFKKKSDVFAQALNVNVRDLRFEKNEYNVVLKSRKNKKMNYDYDIDLMKRTDFKIPLGYDYDDNLILLDLFTSNNFGCYIAGSAGGGKSITLRLILTHLVNCKTKSDIQFAIVNTKRVDLKDFQYARNTIQYQNGTDGIEDLMMDQLEEMEKRYSIIEKADCDDIWEFRKKVRKMPFRLLVIEEISAYKNNKEYQRCLELLASQGRGAGIIPILVTQLPNKDIMPNTVKANINTILGHKTIDAIRSEIIAGPESGLEKLKGEGNNKLFNAKYQGVEYQGIYVSKEQMKEVINNNRKKEQ